jgi:glyoxylase-like metal-dependent hydrolase (beta-lactamase superfamily II)
MNSAAMICEGVYIIGSSDISDSMDCCVYLVDAGELVMVDAGAGNGAWRLIDNIQSLGLMPEKLSTIIATHAHIDHIGALSEFKEKYNVKIISHEYDAAAISSGKKVGAEYYGVKYSPCDVDIILSGVENILDIGNTEFHFYHVPGHTPGSMVITIKSGDSQVLFGQDIHGPYHPMWGGEIPKAMESLKKIKSLKADILCEGHYGVIRPAGEIEEFIQEYIDGLKRR